MGACKHPEKRRASHLCKLVKRDEFELVKQLVKDAAFVCRKCGRSAREQINLCNPTPI